jgi:hypothetical protein
MKAEGRRQKAEMGLKAPFGVRWQAERDTALACTDGLDLPSGSQSAVAAALCRRTPYQWQRWYWLKRTSRAFSRAVVSLPKGEGKGTASQPIRVSAAQKAWLAHALISAFCLQTPVFR